MRDLLVLQHDIGQVNFNLGDDSWKEWLDALENYKATQDDEDEDE